MGRNVVIALIGAVLGFLTQRFILDGTWAASIFYGVIAFVALMVGLWFRDRRMSR